MAACVVVGLCGFLFSSNSSAQNRTAAEKPDGPYPLSRELQVLERDLSSPEYREVLPTMIHTDLAAEWQRVGTPDNWLLFLEQHGGEAKVQGDPALKAAYEKRRQIADRFLALMRAEYAKRKLKPPFDDAKELERVLREAGRSVSDDVAPAVPVRVVLPAPGAERYWPRFRGPTGQGSAAGTTFPMHWSPTENIAWQVELPGRGNGSPVVWGEQIFVTSENESRTGRLLLCFNRSDGQLLWKREAPQPEQTEKLYWKNTFASSTPVTDGQRVIVFFGNSGLVCWDMDGNLQWHRPLGPFTTTHGPGTSPVLYRDRVIFIQDQNRGDSVFVCLDKRTGELLWQRPRPRAMCWSTPVVLRVGDHDELVYNGSYHVIGYDPDTGEEIWRAEGTTREAIPTIVVGGGLIYSASGRNGPTMAIRPGGRGDVTKTHIVWKTVRGAPHVPSPTYYDGRLYMVNDTGIMTCLDARNGETVWQKRLRGRFSMSPIEAGGKLLLTNEDGRSYILATGPEFQVLAENELDDGVLATPALVEGRLYFRTTGRLLCVAEGE